MSLVKWLQDHPLLLNLLLAAAAIFGSAFVEATQDGGPFKVDWPVFGAAVWLALRAAIPTLVAWLQKRRAV